MQAIAIVGSVGFNGLNAEKDVRAVQERLLETQGVCSKVTGRCDSDTVAAILEFQAAFVSKPDGLISANGQTLKMLNRWSIKQVGAGVDLRGNLRKAWDVVNPFLPDGSYCSSGYRSAEDQRRILHKFYSTTYKPQIVKKYGAAEYTTVWTNRLVQESRVLEMVRGVGQAIAAPGRSMHQQGRAVDIGGPDAIDAEQKKIVEMVAQANPTLFSGMVLKERNGCVHFEIR
ncbi:MAG: D-alanyl-D-alanine carboxypeptidase family protein [Thermomicrobiales bacterium]